MATVVGVKGWVGSFYSNETNEPCHIHMFKGGGQAKFWVRSGGVVFDEARGLKRQEIAEARRIVEVYAEEIERKWNED